MNNTVVSKIRVKHPNKPGTKNSNAEYCKYIATRSGVWTIQDTLMSDDPNYAAYISKRPNSHGLFGNINVNSLSNTCNYIKHKSEAGNLIYRGILSLDKEDAADLGYLTQRKWINLLNETMSSIAAEFHIPIENLEWVGAFHFEKDHPHVHYMFWNKEQQIVSPFIHTSKQQRCREIFSKEIYKDERALYIQKKTATRDLILELGKDVMSQSKSFIQDLSQLDKERKTPDKIYPKEISILSKSLIKLANDLPEQGKMVYSYMPHDIKEKICVITDSLFNRVDMRKELMNYLAVTENISKSYSTTQLKQHIQKSSAYKDIQKRLGNIILKSAVAIKNNQNNSDLTHTFLDNDSLNIPFNNDIFSNNGFSIEEAHNDIPIKSYDLDLEDDFNNNPENYSLPSSSSYINNSNNTTNYWTKEYKAAKKVYCGNKTKKPNLDLALSLLNKEAENSNPLALYDLGRIYERGVFVHPDATIANEYYKKAFNIMNLVSENEKTNTYIHYRLGKLYQSGIGTEQNLIKAYDLFQNAANSESSAVQYSLGKLYADKNAPMFNLEKAIDSFQASIDLDNNSFSLCSLGRLYADKTNDCYNLNKALKLFQNAAEQKNSSAFFSLGKLYADKDSPMFNLEKAIDSFQASIDLDNNSFSLCSLGKLYSNKSNDCYNLDKALKLFQSAAEQKNSSAFLSLGKLYQDKESPLYNIQKSFNYYKQSEELGNDLAKIERIKICLDHETPYFSLNAIDELILLAKNDNSYAQCTLGMTYLFNENFKQKKSVAFNWLQKAAKQGNTYSQQILDKDKEMNKLYIRQQTVKTILNIFDSLVSYNQEVDYEVETNFTSKQAIKEYLKKQGVHLEKN